MPLPFQMPQGIITAVRPEITLESHDALKKRDLPALSGVKTTDKRPANILVGRRSRHYNGCSYCPPFAETSGVSLINTAGTFKVRPSHLAVSKRLTAESPVSPI